MDTPETQVFLVILDTPEYLDSLAIVVNQVTLDIQVNQVSPAYQALVESLVTVDSQVSLDTVVSQEFRAFLVIPESLVTPVILVFQVSQASQDILVILVFLDSLAIPVFPDTLDTAEKAVSQESLVTVVSQA